jgi:hypothetical protein
LQLLALWRGCHATVAHEGHWVISFLHGISW